MREVKADVKAIKDITLSVQSLTQSVKTLTESMKEIKDDIIEIKKEPASAWRNLKGTIIGIIATIVVGGIITALFSLIIK